MTNEQILSALNKLGSTSQEVADSLRILGAKGKIADGCSCPIAQYMKGLGVRRPVIGNSTLQHEDGIVRDMPAAVQGFIIGLDDGDFPALEEVEVA